MFFQDIGRTIGDIFGFNKKKREDRPRPAPLNQGGRGVGVLQTRYQQPQGQQYNRTFQPQQQNPFQKPQQPSTLGQPIQAPEPEAPPPIARPPRPGIGVLKSSAGPPPLGVAKPQPNPINDVGKFLATGVSKLANTGYAGIQGATGLGMAAGQMLAGNQAEANRIGTITRQEMDQTLNKGGLFGTGGNFKSTQEAADIKPIDFSKKFVAGGLAAASEIAPISRGVGAANAARKTLTRPELFSIGKQSAGVAGLGSAGAQYTETGKIDPVAVGMDATVGGVLGPLVAGGTSLAKPVVSRGLGAAYRGVKNVNMPNIDLPSVSNEATALKPLAMPGAKPPVRFKQPGNAFAPEAVTPQMPKIVEPNIPQIKEGNLTSTDYMDQLYKNVGIDTEEGLVKGNVLYNNPLTKKYNQVQQGYIEGVDKLRDKVAGKIQQGLESDNPITSRIVRAPQVAFKNFGQSDKNRQILDTRSSKIQAAGKVAKTVEDDMQKVIQATKNPELTNERLYRVLEEPDYLQKVYGNPQKLTPADLDDQERLALQKLIASNKIRNDINYSTGIINEQQHAKYADGFHSPRIYDLQTEGKPVGAPKMLDTKASVKRKNILDIDDEITSKALKSPTLGSSARLETALRNKANLEALDEMSQVGIIRPTAPNKNYTKLEGKKYGRHEGQYIDKQIKSQLDQIDYFNSDLGQRTGDIVNSYQDTKLGTLDRFNKKVKTVFAPATNIGNISSNVLAFSGAANVNPATMASRMTQAGVQLAKHSSKFDPNVYRAEKAGLFAGDTGKQLLGTNDDKLKTLTKGSKNPIKKIESFYGNTDKAAALGLFNEFKARGLTDAQAVRRTHKATQNYSNAGRGVNLLADSPIVGKPFARFTPELLRIMKNNALYNPLGTATKVGALAAGGSALSNAAGETTEERQARETAVGQTSLPFTGGINSLITDGKNTDNVSLNLPIGDSAVNIARASGLNFPIEPGGDPNSALGRQLQPWADMTRTTVDGEEKFAPNQAVSSLTFKPLADQIANRDFMQRQISDPTNKIRSEIGKGKSQYENPDGTRQSPGEDAERGNRIRHAIQNYAPLANEADAIISAATKKPDYYGKDRTMNQALLRGVGLKTESNAKDAREKRVQNKEFFEGKDKQVKEFLRNNKEVADQYFKFNDSSRDRFTNKKSSALVTPEKWAIVKGENSGKLFEQLKREAIEDNKKDGKPMDPIYTTNDPSLTKELINLRATPPGEDIERQEILRATTNWFPEFEKAESKFYKDIDKYWESQPKSKNPADKNDRVKAWGDIEYPTNSALQDQYYTLRYGNEEKGIAPNEEAGKAFYKANADTLNAERDNQKTAKLDYYNKKRAILGLDPIDEKVFNNSTFGYDDDESSGYSSSKYASRGGGRSGGSGDDLGSSYHSLAISVKSGGEIAKPKVTRKPVKPITFARNKTKAGTKPKVSIKASRV